MPVGLLIFVSGPSGAGKSTICRRLAEELPAEFALSATTRAGTPQDAKGKRYTFVKEEEFKRLLEEEAFLEYANVFGNWYGTLKKPVQESLAAGKLVLLEIDVQGAVQVHRIFPDSMGIFILPPHDQALLTRLRGRGRDDEETIQRRFTEAKNEIDAAQKSGAYDMMATNDDLETVIREIKAEIEKFRQSR